MNNFSKGEFVETVRYVWIIDNFFEMYSRNVVCIGRKLYSPYFPIDGNEDSVESWRVDIRASRKSPNNTSETGEVNYLVIHIWNRNPDYSMSPAFADYCKIEMLNSKQDSICRILVPKAVTWPDHCFNTYCNMGELIDHNVESKNTLTMVISIGMDPKPRLQNPMYKDVLQIPRLLDVKYAKETPSLMKSLKDMYEQDFLTDIIIKTKEKNFPCHKVVLAASSEFFRGMFECDMKESAESVVQLEGVFDAAVLEAAIHYMYTEEAPSDVDDLFLNLYMAADYFQLQRLKNICVETMCEHIDVENASEILHLADKFKEEELKSIVVKFISENLPEVMGKPGWSNIPGDVIKDLLPVFLQFNTKEVREQMKCK